MIILKTAKELELMREAGRITAQALRLGGEHCKPGVSTKEIDTVIREFICSKKAKPSFLGYGGFPGSACISINDEVIHGIPSKSRILREGDVVSIDVGAYYNGYHGDSAYTFMVGEVAEDAKKLLKVTEESLYQGIRQAVVGNRIGDISFAVQSCVEAYGYGVVRQYVGHGVGQNLHEAPDVPNFGRPQHGIRLTAGMVIAIEPMINLSGDGVYVMPDQWTVKTKSGSISAHFEHTIAITNDGPVILTQA
ncbi:MAG TPA: type I methionyl aminopeptidase [Firmicutes bacterium]|nr:type I methionyl aminopeptidase [Bacillota bacterium]